jgi:formate dehydrogenase subunit gamma
MSTSSILANGRICRYPLRERVVHWIAGISYVYLLLTGLAFWSPWLFWLSTLFGGGTLSRELHPWVGLVFVIAVGFMSGLWASQMHTTQTDREFWRALPHYVRNEDEEVPPADRFNGGQKLLFWGFFWCGIFLLLSGLILWFAHLIPWSLRYFRYAAVIIHPVAALLTLGLFIIHIYMGTALERGSFHSMVSGDVSMGWARKFHPAWYDRLMRAQR